MGERGVRQEPATEADLKEMSDHVREAVRAGALAFSTNRMPLHTSIHGDPVPGTFAEHHELETLTRAVIEGGGHDDGGLGIIVQAPCPRRPRTTYPVRESPHYDV